jgi:hypothetical protein
VHGLDRRAAPDPQRRAPSSATEAVPRPDRAPAVRSVVTTASGCDSRHSQQSLGLGGLDRGREAGVGAEGASSVSGNGLDGRRRTPAPEPARPCARRPCRGLEHPAGALDVHSAISASSGNGSTTDARCTSTSAPRAPARDRCARCRRGGRRRPDRRPGSRTSRPTTCQSARDGQSRWAISPGSRNGDGGHVHRLTAWSTPLKATTTNAATRPTGTTPEPGERPEPVRGPRIPGLSLPGMGPGLRPHPLMGMLRRRDRSTGR